MKRRAIARWRGNLQNGSGDISLESGVLKETAYSFKSRFGDMTQQATNPEELLAAAHAGCFSMALSSELNKLGLSAESIETEALVDLEKVGDAWSITRSHLILVASVPKATDSVFRQAADTAKDNCPVSKLFNAEITLETKLISSITDESTRASA